MNNITERPVDINFAKTKIDKRSLKALNDRKWSLNSQHSIPLPPHFSAGKHYPVEAPLCHSSAALCTCRISFFAETSQQMQTPPAFTDSVRQSELRVCLGYTGVSTAPFQSPFFQSANAWFSRHFFLLSANHYLFCAAKIWKSANFKSLDIWNAAALRRRCLILRDCGTHHT